MKIFEGVGSTSYNFKIQQDCQSLVFEMTLGATLDDILDVIIQLNSVGDNSRQIIQAITLGELMQMKNEGTVKIDSTGDAALLRFVYDLSSEGYLNFNSEKYLTVSLTNVTNVVIYAVDSPSPSNKIRKVIKQNLTQTSETSLGNLGDVQGILFDPSLMSQLRLYYPGGSKQTIHDSGELEGMMQNIDEVVTVDENGTITTGYYNQIYLPIPYVGQVWITPTDTMNVYLLTEEEF